MKSARTPDTPDAVAATPPRRSTAVPDDAAALRGWLAARRIGIEAVIVVSLTVLAAALRIWHLGTMPLGLHGDEAWTGLDARHVVQHGWIAPYVSSALGQPTGPLYLTAALFKILPQTTFTLRFSMALFGIATIPLAYAAFRSIFGRTADAFAALLLAVMTWHLHLTRSGFMIAAWPFIEVAVVWALFAGIRRRSIPLLALAGALTGAGIYTYNAYLLFVPAVAVGVVWAIARAPAGLERRRLVAGAGALVLAALIVATPMLVFISGHGETYRFHQSRVSVTSSQAWKDAGVGGKANILRHRFDEWAEAIARGDRPDFGDGLAAPGHPVVDHVTLALALIGLAIALWRWRRTEYAVVLAVIAVGPIGALATTGDGLFRRTFGMTPFIALLAALPLAWLWDRVGARRDLRGAAAVALCGVLVAYPAIANVHDYFGPVQQTPVMLYTYPYQEDAASHYIAGLPKGTLVEFYSDRWGFNYETRRFIAPDAIGIDRSHEFGGVPAEDPLDLTRDPSRDVAFVFLGNYLDDADAVIAKYPGGTLTEGHRGTETTFRAYSVPAD